MATSLDMKELRALYPAESARLSALTRTTIGALVGTAAVMGYAIATIVRSLDAMTAVLVAVPLIVAGIIAIGWRWAPVLGVLVSGLLGALLVLISGELAGNIGGPIFNAFALLAPLAAVGLASGIAATVQNYRRPLGQRRMPRALPYALVALAAFAAGLIAVAAVPRPGVRMGISPQAMASLPAVTVEKFEGGEMRVKAGEVVMVRLENPDMVAHSFDVDALNVHAPMTANADSLAVFSAPEPGRYTFYCMPHYDKASGQGMHGTLIVE